MLFKYPSAFICVLFLGFFMGNIFSSSVSLQDLFLGILFCCYSRLCIFSSFFCPISSWFFFVLCLLFLDKLIFRHTILFLDMHFFSSYFICSAISRLLYLLMLPHGGLFPWFFIMSSYLMTEFRLFSWKISCAWGRLYFSMWQLYNFCQNLRSFNFSACEIA